MNDEKLLYRARLVVDNYSDDVPNTLFGHPVTVELIVRFLRGEDIEPAY